LKLDASLAGQLAVQKALNERAKTT
jgi:hypothetical protein